MDSSRSDPVRITANVANEIFSNHCSLEDRHREWPELEQFWDGEKQRLQELDGQTRPLSSSLEEHLLHGDYIKEPTARNETSSNTTELQTIKGGEIKDIPTSYMVGGFKPHELIVIGTYVHNKILPGFRYKVRQNLSDEYLFDGKALHLENIGLGYGKRLTFQGKSLNENNNYFWSDSRVHGFAFIFQAIITDTVFSLLDMTTNQVVGRVIINDPTLSNDVELSTVVAEGGRVEKKVKVHFSCDVIVNDRCNRQNIFVEEVVVKGVASVIRDAPLSMARVEEITLQEFIMDDCKLFPEE